MWRWFSITQSTRPWRPALWASLEVACWKKRNIRECFIGLWSRLDGWMAEQGLLNCFSLPFVFPSVFQICGQTPAYLSISLLWPTRLERRLWSPTSTAPPSETSRKAALSTWNRKLSQTLSGSFYKMPLLFSTIRTVLYVLSKDGVKVPPCG